MRTPVIMERDFNGTPIRQNSKTEMFKANDLLAAANSMGLKKQIGNFMHLESTSELVEQVCYEENLVYEDVLRTARGKNGGTWMHPILFVDFAMWLSPKFKYEVLKWVQDGLLDCRNNSGDSNRMMNKVLAETFPEDFEKPITYARVASQIAAACRVGTGKDKWQTATKDQLELRDKIQNNIATFAPAAKNLPSAISSVIKRTLEMEEAKNLDF